MSLSSSFRFSSFKLGFETGSDSDLIGLLPVSHHPAFLVYYLTRLFSVNRARLLIDYYPSVLLTMPGPSRRADDYDYQVSHHGSGSPGSDEIWADEEDLLAVPEFNPEVERGADPMFPSPHKFNLMVQEYLRNLSPKKREKALLTQKMYDAVLAVLEEPKDTSTKTAQFFRWRLGHMSRLQTGRGQGTDL